MFSLTGIFFGHFPCLPWAEGTLNDDSKGVVTNYGEVGGLQNGRGDK